MGETTIIFGRIAVNGDLMKAKEFIETFQDDNKYPWFRTEMFSFSSFDKQFYFREPIIGFAASYKNLEHSLKDLIIKFEYLLLNIEFSTAKLQMETEMFGTYDFFWKRKTDYDKFEDEDKLIETKNWFFGHGQRNIWGQLQLESNEPMVFPFSYEYPIQFDKEILEEFYLVVDKSINLGFNRKIYFDEYLRKERCDNSLFHPIFTYYEVRNIIECGYETGRGFWIIKKNEILRIE